MNPRNTLKLLRFTRFAQATRSAALSLQPIERSQHSAASAKPKLSGRAQTLLLL